MSKPLPIVGRINDAPWALPVQQLLQALARNRIEGRLACHRLLLQRCAAERYLTINPLAIRIHPDGEVDMAHRFDQNFKDCLSAAGGKLNLTLAWPAVQRPDKGAG